MKKMKFQNICRQIGHVGIWSR